ncbi:MAG: class I SAM-dependent methyltransferase, partial [Alphaproteobacteria bacterium]|nr:class I SAM-dependent methyltransferase [Alphaproteobacteria bacterium]
MTDATVLFAAAQTLHKAGRSADARERCQRLLEQQAQHSGALHLLGLIAFQTGEKAEAAQCFSQAAAQALSDGDGDMALQCAVAAVSAQETSKTRRLFADVAGALRFSQDDRVVRLLLTRALREEWGPLAPLASAAAGVVKARLVAGGNVEDDELLHAMLVAAPITDAELEAVLTEARRKLLIGGGNMQFAAALAEQCLLNGYVFAQTKDETARVAAMRARLETGGDITEAERIVLTCYAPPQNLLVEEKRRAAELPMLTPVTNAPEEQTPWPRWHGFAAAENKLTLREYLAGRFGDVRLAKIPEKPAMLSAGCGTGQYALHLASMLTLESVTAIDLSRANLAFAAAKAQEADLDARFGQGDILQVAAIK